jgi:hypothetical protein
MSKNTTAIQRGALLAKHKIASEQKQGAAIGFVKIDRPNRAQRRAAKKKTNEQQK